MKLRRKESTCKKLGDTYVEDETGEKKEMLDDMQLIRGTEEINRLVCDKDMELVTWEIKEKAEDMQLNQKAGDTNVGMKLDTREINEETDNVQLNQDPKVISREAGITNTDHTKDDMLGTLLTEIDTHGRGSHSGPSMVFSNKGFILEF